MTKEVKVQKNPIERTSAGLRGAIFDELDALRNGDTNATNANATAKLALAIVSTVEMELEVHKVMSKAPRPDISSTALPAIALVG